MVNIPIAVVGIWLTAVNAPSPCQLIPRAIDWPGQSLGVLLLGGMTVSFIEASSLGWYHPLVLSGLGLFRNRTFTSASLIGASWPASRWWQERSWRVSGSTASSLIGQKSAPEHGAPARIPG